MNSRVVLIIIMLILLGLAYIPMLRTEPQHELVLRISKLHGIAMITLVDIETGEVKRIVTSTPTVKLMIERGEYILLVYSPVDKLLGIKKVSIYRSTELFIELVNIDIYKGSIVYRVHIPKPSEVLEIREIDPFGEHVQYIHTTTEYIFIKVPKTSVIIVKILPKGTSRVLHPTIKSMEEYVPRTPIKGSEIGRPVSKVSIYKPEGPIKELLKLLSLIVIPAIISLVIYLIARRKV